jgi:hypothetical protein
MWSANKIFSILVLIITLVFISKIILEIISCMWIIKEISSLGGDYNIDDYRNIVNKLASVCKLSLAYSVVMLIYSIYKFKK